MIGLLAFAGKYWKWIAVGLAVLAVGLIVKGHFDGDAKVKRDLATVQWSIDNPATGWRARLAQSEKNEATCEVAIKTQNAAVTALKADGDARAAAATKAALDALQARREANQTADRLAAYKSADTCPDREAGIADLVKGLTR